MRISTKLTILSLCLAIIPLVFVVNVFLYNAQKELTEAIYGRLSAVSTLKKDRLETYFVSRKEDLKAAQGLLDVKINLPTLEQFAKDRYNFAYLKAVTQLKDQLRAFMNSYQYADIMLLDTKGRVVFTANPAHAEALRDKTILNAVELEKATRDSYISDPVATADEHYPYVVYMACAVRDIQEQFSGYIVLAVDMNAVYGFISKNTGVGQTGETLLVKAMPGNRFLFISPLLHDPQAMLKKEMAAFGNGRIGESIDYRGKEVLAVGQHLPSLDWELITKIDRQEVFAPVINMRNLFFSICVIVLFIIVFSSFVFAESISGPIRKLQKGAGIIGQGDLDHKVGMPSKDEIGHLSRTFDEMVDNLKKTMASRDELEEEVVRRQKAEEETRKLTEELRTMSIHDPLTGVLNRRGLQDVLSKTVSMGQRMDISTQALLLDLDNFKQINDHYGHGVGDTVLVAVTGKIQQAVRQTDYIARVGGDEFMVLLLDSREAEAVMVADKIRMAIAQAFGTDSSGRTVKTTCSMGIVPLGDRPISIDGLLQKLHLSLHLSKGEGKNRISYQGARGQVELKDPDTASEVKRVLVAGDKFYVAAQPIFDLRDMTRTGYELLCRLDHEGYASPDAFLLFARNADLLGIVDYACMRACLNAVKNAVTTKRIHINIFPSTLVELPIEQLLQEFSSAGKNINFCLEINEQQILGDPLYLSHSIGRLKKAGVMIALDDYGFGRSSVETLILLEPDIVKIDKKIIKDISKDGKKLNSLIRLLRVIESCKASVIAEGIETDEDLRLLLSLGVTSGQGFLMGKPEIPPNLT